MSAVQVPIEWGIEYDPLACAGSRWTARGRYWSPRQKCYLTQFRMRYAGLPSRSAARSMLKRLRQECGETEWTEGSEAEA